ncbi:hypothetical protein ACS0TY_023011 [Phlomoides rotata]
MDDTIKISPFGIRTGESWDGKGHDKIVQIFVSHGDKINSIHYQYAAENEKLMMSELHGNTYGCKYDVVSC